MAGSSTTARKVCNQLCEKITSIIRDKLSPALDELLKSHSNDFFSSIDIDKLASAILPDNNHSPKDFVFEYEKKFVKKVETNHKKVTAVKNDIQFLTNKISVMSRKLNNSRKQITELKTELITQKVDIEASMKKSVHEQVTAALIL